MKVKSLVKVVSATKIQITAENYNGIEFYTFHIDYLSNKCKDYGEFGDYTSFAKIPDEIKNREVKIISVDSATGELSIWC